MTDDQSTADRSTPPVTGTVVVPRRQWRGLRAGARRPRGVGHRNPWVRLLVALTSSGALLLIAGLVAAAAVVPPIGARRSAREDAAREVAAQLQPGETMLASTFASQRRWTDMWRESFGVLVATNHRVLYIGAPPTPLLRPRDEGPNELLVESYPYDAAFTLDTAHRRWPIGDGLLLRTPAGEVNFIIDQPDMIGARAVATLSARARRALTQQGLDPGERSPPPPPEVYVPYVVRRGETLTGLARRFNTTPDVLRQLNQLTDDNIRIGQRLRVPAVDSTR